MAVLLDQTMSRKDTKWIYSDNLTAIVSLYLFTERQVSL